MSSRSQKDPKTGSNFLFSLKVQLKNLECKTYNYFSKTYVRCDLIFR